MSAVMSDPGVAASGGAKAPSSQQRDHHADGVAGAAAAASSAMPAPPPVATPAERLASSRAQIRAVMFPPPVAPPAPGASRMDHWMASVRQWPGVDLLVDTAQAWWARHPLRPVSHVAAEASRLAMKPIAVQHPYALLLVAAAAGALLAGMRPWRWALRSALFAGFLPQILSRTVAKLPIESWVKMFAAAVADKRARSPEAPTPPAAATSAKPGAYY